VAPAAPEDAFEALEAALRSGSPEAALRHMAAPEEAAWAKVFEAARAHAAYTKALDEKFGKAGPDEQLGGPLSILAHAVAEAGNKARKELQQVEMVGKDRARLTVWTREPLPQGKERIQEHAFEAVRVGGRWKLPVDLPLEWPAAVQKEVRKVPGGNDIEVLKVTSLPRKNRARDSAAWRKIAAAFAFEANYQAQAVRAGKFQSRAKALAAYYAATSRVEAQLSQELRAVIHILGC
jgi:hypothetical protein